MLGKRKLFAVGIFILISILFIPLMAFPAEKKVVRVWHTETEPQSVAGFQQIINDFEKLHPDITVKQEALAWGDLEAKLTAALAAGAPIVDRNELYTHNCQYTLAAAAIYGEVSRKQYSMERRGDPEILSLADRITIIGDKVLEEVYPEIWGSIVEIFTVDGRHLTKRVDYAKGSPENPLNDEEISQKFLSLAEDVIGKEKGSAICEKALNLEAVDNIQEICLLLRTGVYAWHDLKS